MLVERLRAAAQEAELESETIVARFRSHEIDTKEFIKQYTAARRLHHHRLAKSESLLKHFKPTGQPK